MLQWALKYQKLGLSVIPVEPCGKQPLIAWKEYQTRLATETEINQWFAKWPNANIGVVTGSISNCCVVDVDGVDGMQSLSSLKLVSNQCSLSGKGRHLWYRHPGVNVGNSVRQYPGIDIRGDGGFVVVPPSIHLNGNRYRWLKPVISVERLPMFPTAVFAPVVPTTELVVKNAHEVRNEAGWVTKALEEMTNGNIDNTLFRICSKLRNGGYTESDCLVLLGPHAERVGADPGHLQDKIRNVWGRYEPRSVSGISASGGSGQLVLHSPTNPDSCNEYSKRQLSAEQNDGIGTGYPKFDTLTKGIKKGEVLTVAARTGVGKTNWIITPIRTFCEAGKSVLLFSTEMSFDQIWTRYRSTLQDSTGFTSHNFYICDDFTPDVARIEEAIRHVQPDLFIFDHISNIGTDYHIISKFMSEIKRLARLFNIPAIVTAQLNRNADWVEAGVRVEPRISQIQGSGSIEQLSAQVLLLHEKRVYPEYVEIEGIIGKNRHGDKGTIPFGLFKNPYRICEL